MGKLSDITPMDSIPKPLVQKNKQGNCFCGQLVFNFVIRAFLFLFLFFLSRQIVEGNQHLKITIYELVSWKIQSGVWVDFFSEFYIEVKIKN